jgi:ring-1,2-phenylacetyl-CoA epoxidase subunit PaaB
MNPDSQWPRYEVFKQDHPGRPHQNVGSVHAPDPELALQNARDVFARRPSNHSLWVVPAEAIVELGSGGVEEQGRPGDLETGDWRLEIEDEEENRRSAAGGRRSFALFAKQSQRQGMTYVDYVGEVEATSAAEALQQAPIHFPKVPAIVWWACPLEAITRSQKEDADSLFSPANDKRFRMPNEYRTVFQMQKIKQKGSD